MILIYNTPPLSHLCHFNITLLYIIIIIIRYKLIINITGNQYKICMKIECSVESSYILHLFETRALAYFKSSESWLGICSEQFYLIFDQRPAFPQSSRYRPGS